MPFNVQAAAAFIRRVVLKFNSEKLELRYNAGEGFKTYEGLSQKLQQRFLDLQRQLEKEDASDEAYERLQEALGKTRREIANNLCAIIEWWDLEGDRDAIRALMSKEDQKKHKDVTGHGEIPIDGAWLDALPLPDLFILNIRDKIEEDFSTGGAGRKNS